ncbi:MAG: ABC transporter substrate-binding protein [Burkholderiales bacterium]
MVLVRRRQLLLASGALLAASSGLAQAQTQLPRVGVLSPGAGEFIESPVWRSFLLGLSETGWTDGRNVEIVRRYTESKQERVQAAAAEFVKMKVDVLYASGPTMIVAARRATGEIPIVGNDLESDPVALGFASSLARPGGNFTGVFLDVPELMGKHLDLLREMIPGLSRVGVVGDPAVNAAQFHAAGEAAKRLGLQLKTLEFRRPEDLDAAFADAAKSGLQALVLFSSPPLWLAQKKAGELAARYRVPAISVFGELTRAGVLMSYGPRLTDVFRRCGSQVGRILKGEKVATMPIERPHVFEFVVNAKAAKGLGLKVPQSLLVRADEVIQ